MRYLVIKTNKNSFEETINKWFMQCGIDVVCIEDVIGKHTGLEKRFEIIRFSIKLKKTKYDKIIIFDDFTFYLWLTLYVRKNTFLWLWNTFDTSLINNIRLFISKFIGKVYSFDFGDVNIYKLNENTQFFQKPKYISSENTNTVFFVGMNKGRVKLLNELYEYCVNNSIKTDFNIVCTRDEKDVPESLIRSSFMSYDKVLSRVNKSNAVLDICKPGQTGMTYRAMEAVFFDKKIISNNVEYKKLPFYSSNMVFILENDRFDGLKEFLDLPTIAYSDEIKDYYCIENWITRFK